LSDFAIGLDILVSMNETDEQLLADYAAGRADDGFAKVVGRYLDLVHSAALRQVRAPELAEEVSQSVFLDLARQAAQLPAGTVLGAWLYQVTRRRAVDTVRREVARKLREQIALELQTVNAANDDWTPIEPLLDDAMETLEEPERQAVLLRYFQNKPLREVGQILGVTDDAAQKRVSRAVERLRQFFVQRGIAIGASGLALVISTHAVQTAPIALQGAVSTSIAAVGTAVNSLPSITKAVLLMSAAKQKFAIVAALILLLAVGGTFVFIRSQRLESFSRPAMPAAGTGLEFRWLLNEGDASLAAELLPDAQGPTNQQMLRVSKEVILDASHIESATLRQEDADRKEILVWLDAAASQKLAQATEGRLGERLAIIWNGRVINAPVIRAPIRQRSLSITGVFSDAETQTLLDALNR